MYSVLSPFMSLCLCGSVALCLCVSVLHVSLCLCVSVSLCLCVSVSGELSGHLAILRGRELNPGLLRDRQDY